eukprot:TRINITY_DN2116_c0_g1_i14.p1 TRINITY_DN2116_c0_g1~~TRINITY_DN2116_c0_g1_i14.p1  ORF type:complete len:140 (-),score=31.77 TRINITY_DN2116_c0_g1_i14:417-836(-)
MTTSIHTGWGVDSAILDEEERLVLIRFGRAGDPTCRQTDEVLIAIANEVSLHASIHLVDVDEVADFNAKYELYDPCTVMFFFKNKVMSLEFGYGPSSCINWAMKDCEWAVNAIRTIHESILKGKATVPLTRESVVSANQ